MKLKEGKKDERGKEGREEGKDFKVHKVGNLRPSSHRSGGDAKKRITAAELS